MTRRGEGGEGGGGREGGGGGGGKRGETQKRARRAKTRTRTRTRTRVSEGKSCNEDSTSIESDKAACATPVAFNEHSASQPLSAGPFDEYLLLRTRYSIPFRLSPFGDSEYRQGPERVRRRETERERERERERE